MLTLEKEKILEKSKNTPYSHKNWFKEGGKTVFEAIDYYVNSQDFYLDTTIKQFHELPEGLTDDWLSEKTNKHIAIPLDYIISWLIKNNRYDKLVIRYIGKEGGTDRGKLKIQTFLILSQEKEAKKKNNLH